jgi:hypothetical protein
MFNYPDLFNSIPIKDQAEAERLLNTAFSILCYLKDGENFTTPFAVFEKISSDVIYIDFKKTNNLLLDELEKNNIAKIGV